MFNHPKISPEELQELKEIHFKIATIQHFCKQQQNMSIGISDYVYEQAGSMAYNSGLIAENERLVAMQQALIPRCRELGNKIVNDEEYNQIVLDAREEVKDLSRAGLLRYPSITKNFDKQI